MSKNVIVYEGCGDGFDFYSEKRRDTCKRDRLWVPFLLEEMKYFKKFFLRSGVEAKVRRSVSLLNTK